MSEAVVENETEVEATTGTKKAPKTVARLEEEGSEK